MGDKKNNLDRYLDAATRDNTRESYRSAIRHFEVEWGGFLPTTATSVANYLADHAETLSINTLRQRLTALAQWHLLQGFPDPTKSLVVRQTLRGIRHLHPAQEKQAEPLQLDQLNRIIESIEAALETARKARTRADELRHMRNKSLLLLGFWRGFRSDELTRLAIEDVHAIAGEGMTCHLTRTKGDRQAMGTTFKAPALTRLCPVEAYLEWVNAAQLHSGPVYRAINRWGHLSADGLHIDSVLPLLRTILHDAGVDATHLYSTHSLRRGFATWAASNGWDVKGLMEYVGWKDMQSALRYIEAPDPFNKLLIESKLSKQDA